MTFIRIRQASEFVSPEIKTAQPIISCTVWFLVCVESDHWWPGRFLNCNLQSALNGASTEILSDPQPEQHYARQNRACSR